LVASHLDIEGGGARPLLFPLHMQQEKVRAKELKPLARQLGVPLQALRGATQAGERAQERFYKRVRDRGEQVLASLSPDTPAVVLVGRPYNTSDLGVCQDLPLKLRKMGALPIPIDMLPLRSVDISEQHADMFWRSGQDILAAGKIIAEDERLQAIYLTSFDCGPDSFLVSFFRRMLGAKPFLELEVDDHTAEAGIVTRCEAFLDSLNLSARA
ncbi:MAG: acyl-CoA dehydratase activase-related protein, partial [Gemmatimonadota bacterium]|nr:acyl-CoA dehydratase activase-related protein [Gemmatimonadota bacterium]